MFFPSLNRCLFPTQVLNAVGWTRMSVCLNKFWWTNASFGLQIIDILSEVFQKNSFILEFFNKFMPKCRLVLSWKVLFGNLHKSFWIFDKEAKLKNSLRIRQLIFGQLTVKSSFWRSKVRNARSYTEAGSSKHHNVFILFNFETFDQVFIFKDFLLFLSFDSQFFQFFHNSLFLWIELGSVRGEIWITELNSSLS